MYEREGGGIGWIKGFGEASTYWGALITAIGVINLLTGATKEPLNLNSNGPLLTAAAGLAVIVIGATSWFIGKKANLTAEDIFGN